MLGAGQRRAAEGWRSYNLYYNTPPPPPPSQALVTANICFAPECLPDQTCPTIWILVTLTKAFLPILFLWKISNMYFYFEQPSCGYLWFMYVYFLMWISSPCHISGLGCSCQNYRVCCDMRHLVSRFFSQLKAQSVGFLEKAESTQKIIFHLNSERVKFKQIISWPNWFLRGFKFKISIIYTL